MVEDVFAAAHRLVNYCGRCENLHGHNWRVQVFVAGEQLDKDGLLIDFTVLKDRLKDILDELDHNYLNDVAALEGKNPTSENIAAYIFFRLGEEIRDFSVSVECVTLWENERQCASYCLR